MTENIIRHGNIWSLFKHITVFFPLNFVEIICWRKNYHNQLNIFSFNVLSKVQNQSINASNAQNRCFGDISLAKAIFRKFLGEIYWSKSNPQPFFKFLVNLWSNSKLFWKVSKDHFEDISLCVRVCLHSRCD